MDKDKDEDSDNSDEENADPNKKTKKVLKSQVGMNESILRMTQKRRTIQN